LEPNREKIVEDLDLSYWYEPLEPGHYVLSTRHRFVQGGKWVDAASVTFEVERKKLDDKVGLQRTDSSLRSPRTSVISALIFSRPQLRRDHRDTQRRPRIPTRTTFRA